MSQWDKFRQRLLGRQADQNIDFGTLCSFLKHLGFEEDINGSHHLYGMADLRHGGH
jgi:hypothetical protein